MKRVLCFVFIFFVLNALFAQNDSTTVRSVFSLGISGHYGTIFAHSQAVQNTAGANPSGIGIHSTWQFVDDKTWNTCRCEPKMGFSAYYYDFDVALLGKSLTLSYFLEPVFRLNKIFSVSIRGNFGASYLSNPYDPEKNPTNLSYSLPLNAYVALGLGFGIRLDKHWQLTALAEYKHVSNGGIKDPNKGINWPVGSFMVEYSLKPKNYINHSKNNLSSLKKGLRKDVFLFTGNKNVDTGDKERFFIFGLILQVSKQISNLNGITLGTELVNNQALEEKMAREGINKKGYVASLIGGHEFLLGRFTFGQQMGLYLYDPSPYFTLLYQRWTIHYYFNKYMVLGIGMKTHANVAEYADVRLGVSF